MGHGKETPRQKMIGLMYLFLTALMALNVSKDVLKSFVLVGESLENTVENYKSKNEKVYNEFEKANFANPTKVGPWKKDADKVKEAANALFNFLEDHKVGLAKYAEGEETEAVVDGKFQTSLLTNLDNIDQGGEYFGENGLKHGIDIEKKIDEYKALLLEIVPESAEAIISNIEAALETEGKPDHDGVVASWVSSTFEHIPLIADFVMLSQLQTNVKNTETDVINYLFSQISAGDFKVNKIEAMAIAKSNYVMLGGDYSAEVFIAASDSTQDPKIYIGNYSKNSDGGYDIPEGAEELEVINGKGVFKQPARSVGDKKWGGLIELKSPDGGKSFYEFEAEYQVAQSNVVVSPTKMNVFYYGIENPVAISVPGIPASDIIPRITNGASISKASKGYEVKPTKRNGEVNVQVYANIEGKQKLMGAMPFRIRPIPPPIAKVMGKTGGSISKTMLSNAPSVYAELEDFVFDLKFTIVKFNLVATDGKYSKEYLATSSKFTRDQIAAIKGAKKGSRIMIDNIEAKGPDGVVKPLSPIIFKLK